jgi:hypothetical protein
MFIKLLRNLFFTLNSYRKQDDLNGPVFIVGTGRSGTHFLCSCLNNFDGLNDVFEGKESPWVFWSISSRVVNQKALTNTHIGYYKYMQRRVLPKMFLDQTHPNLWNVEQLLQHFPRAKFIAITRNVYSVTYSMKKHGGVSKWSAEYQKYPIPNRFLGITADNYEIYKSKLSQIQRDVFRWNAHYREIENIKSKYPASVLVLDYQELADNMSGVMARIGHFLNLRKPLEYQHFNRESLEKSAMLSQPELAEIESALAYCENRVE